jgi:23S rRNA (uridine2552-2'-O)-methyltransferase
VSRRRSGGSARGSRRGFVKQGNSRYDRHDTYYRKAKEEGFLARSVYKLEEIDRAFKIVRKGDVVLDLGCAPGSWLQYAERRVREKGGSLVGIDLLPVKLTFGAHVRVIQGDIYDVTLEDLLPEGVDADTPFDVVLSDMAPNTTGIRSVDQARSMALVERALDIADELLRPGGRFVAKVFEGGDFVAFVKMLRERFTDVKIRRPKGVRRGSMETYVVALDKKRRP